MTKKEQKAYLLGLIEGIKRYATWKNGVEYVEVMQIPLKVVLQQYQEELEKLNVEYWAVPIYLVRLLNLIDLPDLSRKMSVSV